VHTTDTRVPAGEPLGAVDEPGIRAPERDRHDCPVTRDFDNLTTVPKALLTTRITTIPDTRLPELCNALRAATGC
jgi:mRNA-degrading endonuclease toxin of MazEF toxin-antitoxin module